MSSPRVGDASLPQPTDAQQRVMDRIAVQRERLDARRVQRAQQKAVVRAQSGVGAGAPLLMQVAVVARQYPLATAALAGVAVVAIGPKNAMRWMGVALPLVMRLFGRS